MVKVKICGITNLEDALAAVECGADMLGFIFAPSPRKVDPNTVKDIVAKLPPSVIRVGVFMDHELAEVKETIAFCGLDMAQLHGSESPDFFASLPFKIIKAFMLETLPDLNALHNYKSEFFLLDKQKGSKTRPEELWPIAMEMGAYGRVILAGALTAENISEAITAAQPYAVDVASGVEIEPGKKDHRKMREFINLAKS